MKQPVRGLEVLLERYRIIYWEPSDVCHELSIGRAHALKLAAAFAQVCALDRTMPANAFS